MSETRTIHLRNPEESYLSAGLYIVPTPIGNLRDITLRALEVLIACDAIICEDSRVTGKLLKAYDIPAKKKIIYNDHADEAKKEEIIKRMMSGEILALVSDAGTPLVSDPGYKLVRDSMKAGLGVTALPGANAVLPALQLSGMPSDSFTFAGFLPAKDTAIRNMFKDFENRRETVLFYESPKRIEKTVKILSDLMPDREIAIIREISKLYEETIIKTASQMAEYLTDNPLKGEIVLVIKGADTFQICAEELDKLIMNALKDGRSVKEIAAQISLDTGIRKKDVYDRALSLKQTLKL